MDADAGFQRVGVLARLPEALADLGVEAGAVLAAAGIPAAAIAREDNQLPFEQLDRLLAEAVRIAKAPHIGLLTGQRSSLSSLGLVGDLMRHAPTIRRAMEDLAENQHRYVRGSVVYVADGGETVTIGYAVYQPGFRTGRILAEGAIAAGSRFSQELGAGEPLEVLMPGPATVEPAIYQKLFRAPVRFGTGEAGLVFSAAQLDRPVRGADPMRRAALEEAARSYWALREPSVPHMARRLLRSMVLSGTPDLASLAGRLAIHPRTLNRRLQDAGLTFRSLLNEVRYDVARELLEGTGLSVTQIGLWLGYSEAAAFAHAFRRWAGVGAQEWRASRPAWTGPSHPPGGA
ncbi:AraC family transcriptional regulator ligand-binding domain-containing protein [Alsobacter sp. R-9]